MVTVNYNLIIPLTVTALSEAHAAVLVDWLQRTDPVAYSAEGIDATSPLGEYRVSSATPVMARAEAQGYPHLEGDTIALGTVPPGTLLTPEMAAKIYENHVLDAAVAADALPPPPAEPKKESRRRTKKWEGTDVITAGISPETIAAIQGFKGLPGSLEALKRYTEKLAQPVLSSLREEEGQALLADLQAMAPASSPESDETVNTPAAHTEQEQEPVEPNTPSIPTWPEECPPKGSLVRTRLGDGIAESWTLIEDDANRGPLITLRMQTGERVGDLIPFYVRELAALVPPPAPSGVPPKPPWLK